MAVRELNGTDQTRGQTLPLGTLAAAFDGYPHISALSCAQELQQEEPQEGTPKEAEVKGSEAQKMALKRNKCLHYFTKLNALFRVGRQKSVIICL